MFHINLLAGKIVAWIEDNVIFLQAKIILELTSQVLWSEDVERKLTSNAIYVFL